MLGKQLLQNRGRILAVVLTGCAFVTTASPAVAQTQSDPGQEPAPSQQAPPQRAPAQELPPPAAAPPPQPGTAVSPQRSSAAAPPAQPGEAASTDTPAAPSAAAPPPPYPVPPYDLDYERRDRPAPRPVVMDYVEGDPVPPGFTVVRRRRKGLVITGSILLGVAYGISLSIAAGSEYSNPWGWLALPILGPVIASTQVDDCNETDDYSCDDQDAQRGFLMVDTLTQAAGAAMLIVGLTVDKKVMIQNLAVDLSLRPVLARHSSGLELAAGF